MDEEEEEAEWERFQKRMTKLVAWTVTLLVLIRGEGHHWGQDALSEPNPTKV